MLCEICRFHDYGHTIKIFESLIFIFMTLNLVTILFCIHANKGLKWCHTNKYYSDSRCHSNHDLDLSKPSTPVQGCVMASVPQRIFISFGPQLPGCFCKKVKAIPKTLQLPLHSLPIVLLVCLWVYHYWWKLLEWSLGICMTAFFCCDPWSTVFSWVQVLWLLLSSVLVAHFWSYQDGWLQWFSWGMSSRMLTAYSHLL